MRAFRAAAGVVGVAVVAAVVGLVVGVVTPGAVASLSAAVAAVDGARYLGVLAAAVLLAGLWFARRRSGSADDPFAELVETPPEGVSAPASIRVGGEFDRLVADALASDDEDAMRPVASRLRETAVGLYADATDADPETARRRVREGSWTDDELAAALLAAERTFPLRSRLRAWLDPARERRRRVDAATDALFALRAGAVPDATPTRSDGEDGDAADSRRDGDDDGRDGGNGDAGRSRAARADGGGR